MNKNAMAPQKSSKSKLPPLSVSQDVWDEQMKRTLKNITIRPSKEHAEMLVFLDLEVNIPKATVVKKCLEKALPAVFQEIMDRLQGWKNSVS